MKALLLCSGPFKPSDLPGDFSYDLVVAVDGGYVHARALGLKPDFLIGDMDSLPHQSLIEAEEMGIPLRRFPTIKNKTDTHLAVDFVIDKGYTDIVILGALGRRMDHTLSNMSLLQYMYQKGCNGVLVDTYNEIRYLTDTLILYNRVGHLLSIVPITPLVGLTLNGVAYPLDEANVSFASSLCVSNVIQSPQARISLRSGEAYVMLTQDQSNEG